MLRILSYIAIVGCFIAPSRAYAYLDAGTGSILLQGLLAAFVGAGMFWRRVKAAFSALFGRKNRAV